MWVLTLPWCPWQRAQSNGYTARVSFCVWLKPPRCLSFVVPAFVQAYLAQYVAATEQLWGSEAELQTGRCATNGYSAAAGSANTSWAGRLDQLLPQSCLELCGCELGKGDPGANTCPDDGADEPTTGKWCSLCGPSTSCPARPPARLSSASQFRSTCPRASGASGTVS